MGKEEQDYCSFKGQKCPYHIEHRVTLDGTPVEESTWKVINRVSVRGNLPTPDVSGLAAFDQYLTENSRLHPKDIAELYSIHRVFPNMTLSHICAFCTARMAKIMKDMGSLPKERETIGKEIKFSEVPFNAVFTPTTEVSHGSYSTKDLIGLFFIKGNPDENQVIEVYPVEQGWQHTAGSSPAHFLSDQLVKVLDILPRSKPKK